MVSSDRIDRGSRNYHAGRAAEENVCRHYVARGYELMEERWRGGVGEIDLIFERAGEIIFVEVKCASSHERARQRIGPVQRQRLLGSAEAYLADMPDGALTCARFDVASVDRCSSVRIEPNALMQE